MALLNVAPASETFAANRAVGEVAFDVRASGDVTRRGAVREAGSLRVRFPSPEQAGLSAMLLNTAGGIAGGDRFDIEASVGANAALTVTTAAAEKVYRSHGPDALVNIRLKAEQGARLSWLPQETILFDRARVMRSIEIELAEEAALVLAEIVVFGRLAMGERVSSGRFIDRWRLRRGGKLVFAENVRLDGDVGAALHRSASANGGIAIGTALVVPGDEAVVARVREASEKFGSEVGASAWNGFAMIRFCAHDPVWLRAHMVAVLTHAVSLTPPRLWLS